VGWADKGFVRHTDTDTVTDHTIRLDQEIDKVLTTYCQRAKRTKCEVIAEAVAFYEAWLKTDRPKSPKHTHYLFLSKAKKSRRLTVVRGTTLSAATLWTLGEVRGMRSIGRAINDALRVFFWEEEKNRVAAHDPTGISRFREPLPVDLNTGRIGNWFKKLPTNQVLLQDATPVPAALKGAPVLIDSSYLLGVMIGERDSFQMGWYGAPAEGGLLDRALAGDIVLTTTTAQIAEFSEKAAGFFTAKNDQELRTYFASSLGQDLPRAASVHLAERLKTIRSLGIAIMPVEAEDYAKACAINGGGWPVTLSKLAGIASMMRITGSTEVFCLSLFHTADIPSMHVWEHFTDGYCVEASSSDQRFQSYHVEWTKEYGTPAADEPDLLSEKKNPYFKNLPGLRG
jgi:hypothetical protein